jgi:hypothetical protein
MSLLLLLYDNVCVVVYVLCVCGDNMGVYGCTSILSLFVVCVLLCVLCVLVCVSR